MKKLFFNLFFLFIVLKPAIYAQDDERYVPETDPLVLEKLEKWQDLKFGLLMHWGTYSQWGIVESWSICAEDEGWCRRNNPDYIQYKKDYENLQSTFNPVNFDPDRWAKAAKDAGMKYVIFTTKHHDGFSMFDTNHFIQTPKQTLQKRFSILSGQRVSGPEPTFQSPTGIMKTIGGPILLHPTGM
jgi:alpha-L-fucosidase